MRVLGEGEGEGEGDEGGGGEEGLSHTLKAGLRTHNSHRGTGTGVTHTPTRRNHTTLTRDSHPYTGFTFPRMDTAPKRARATRKSQAGKLTTDHRESHTPSIFMAMVTNHVASASTTSRARAVANKRTPLVCTFREKALLI